MNKYELIYDLKEHLETCSNEEYYLSYNQVEMIVNYFNEFQKENKQLQEQLKQRDEVIEEAITFCNYLLENNEVEINNKKYFKHSCDDIITNAILQKLQK